MLGRLWLNGLPGDLPSRGLGRRGLCFDSPSVHHAPALSQLSISACRTIAPYPETLSLSSQGLSDKISAIQHGRKCKMCPDAFLELVHVYLCCSFCCTVRAPSYSFKHESFDMTASASGSSSARNPNNLMGNAGYNALPLVTLTQTDVSFAVPAGCAAVAGCGGKLCKGLGISCL